MGKPEGIKKELLELKANVPLKNHTSYRIGGRAKYFFEAKSTEDLNKAITMAKQFGLPFFVLGRGSNVLISDKGYKGLVIKIQNSRMKTENLKDKMMLFCDAGVLLSSLVQKSVENGVTGLEWAAGIPGTVGGAIFGNTGAFNKAIAGAVKQVTVFDADSKEARNIKRRECLFGYKTSVFKNNRNLVIVSCVLELKKGNRKEILEEMKKHLRYRREKQPLDFPSAGSIFKNPGMKIKNKRLIKKFPEIKIFNRKKQIPAGFLIEKSGMKGKKAGNAQISEKHANFIINLGEAKAKDVLRLMKTAKKAVKKKFKIDLEEEIQYFGG